MATSKPSSNAGADPAVQERRSFVIPKTIGACADKLWELGERKSKAQRVVDAIAEEERALEAHIVDHLEAGESNAITGRVAKVSIGTKEVPTVKDWPKLWAHIIKLAKRDPVAGFSLLQKRPSEAVFRELWEAGEKVPGVDRFTVKKVSVRKA